MKIGINRTEAIGDILCLSGVITRLKEEGHKVLLSTRYPNIDWKDFLDIDFHSTDLEAIKLMSDKYYDLDMCYENKPKVPIWTAYSEEFFGDSSSIKPKLKDLGIAAPSLGKIVLHPAVSSLSRTLPKQVWEDVAIYIKSTGYIPVVIRQGKDYQLENAPSQRGSLKELIYDIMSAKLFIGMDSGPMHLAQSTNTPIIGVFTIARPSNRIWRPEKTHPVVPDCDCRFCLEQTTAVNYVHCKGDKCIPTITSELIINKIKEVLNAD